jgi:alanyl-tRNA synthetase
LDDLQNKETTITIEKLVDVQKNVNKAILDSVTQLGLMQEHIVCGLTKAQEKIENQQDEMKAAVEILQQNHEDAMKNVSLLKTSYAKAEENLRKCTEQANNALNEATRLSQQAKKTDTDKLVQEAMENAQQFNRKAEQLRRHLGTMKTSLNEAQEKTTDIAKVLGEMTDKQKQIEGNCETLKQQSEMLRASNDVLFGQAEKIGGNLRVVGESVDRIATFTSDAVASVGNVTSRWSNFAAMIGAAAGSIGAAAVGSGVLATGALAVAGVMVAAYTVEANRGHIQEVKDKVIRLKDSIRLIAETSLRNISNITSRITSLGTTIVDFLNRINPLTT